MNKFRVFLVCASLLTATMAVGARTINTLVINRTDGKVDKIAMHKNLDISLNDKGEILMVHPEVTVAYPREQVKSFTAGFQAFASGSYYIGENQVKEDPEDPKDPEEDAIADVAAGGVSIVIDRAVISVSGVENGVKLVDLQGKTVASRKPADGSVEISIAGLPSGVYILIADKTTLKIKI